VASRPGRDAATRPTGEAFAVGILVLTLAGFVSIAYGPSLRLPFIADDYIFLDRTRWARVQDLASFANVDFRWYRPWSREIHFWALQRLFGANPVPFRLAGALLWIAALGLYWRIVGLVADRRVAFAAVLGVASLALWGTPLLWISGSQDLWMLVLSLLALRLSLGGHDLLATVPFAVALLSKETAATFLVVIVVAHVLLRGESPGRALRRTWSLFAVTAVWAIAHPTLRHVLLSSGVTPETLHRPSLPSLSLRTLGSVVNLSLAPNPSDLSASDLLRAVAAAALLGGALWLALQGPAAPAGANRDVTSPRRLVAFALVWMLAGWAPLVLPSIGWHAYYGCVGVLGAWLFLAAWLARRPRLAIAVIAALTMLRSADAATRSWDWGNEWYQRRAGSLLEDVHATLTRLHPSVPAHSRLFFGHVPNNIGLISGDNPAVRVWYADSTLRGGFFSSYRPRRTGLQFGADLFFYYDSTAGLVEVTTCDAPTSDAGIAGSTWADSHTALAMMFLGGAAFAEADTTFAGIACLESHPEVVGYASVCAELAGHDARAESLFTEARQRMHLSAEEEERWLAALRSAVPRMIETGR